MESIRRNNIIISLELNKDRTVDLSKKMVVSYYEQDGKFTTQEMYPDVVEGENYGTIDSQFELVNAVISFEKAYQKSISSE